VSARGYHRALVLVRHDDRAADERRVELLTDHLVILEFEKIATVDLQAMEGRDITASLADQIGAW